MPAPSPAITLDKTINHEKFIQLILPFLLCVNNPQVKRRATRVTTTTIKALEETQTLVLQGRHRPVVKSSWEKLNQNCSKWNQKCLQEKGFPNQPALLLARDGPQTTTSELPGHTWKPLMYYLLFNRLHFVGQDLNRSNISLTPKQLSGSQAGGW